MFAELDGALVAIDGRGVDLKLEFDVQRRAVHLLVVDDVIEAARIQKTAGITKVIAGHQGPIEDPALVKMQWNGGLRSTFPLMWWARWDSNPRSTPCKGGVIAARPQAQPVLGALE